MSLDSLMRHFVTIQHCENAPQTQEGFIDWQGSWTNRYVNVRCNIQYKKGKAIVLEGHKLEERNKTVIYFINETVYNYLQDTVAVRFVVWRRNFSSSLQAPELLQLKDNTNRSLFNLYIPMSTVNETEGQIGTKIRVYYSEVEKTDRMKL